MNFRIPVTACFILFALIMGGCASAPQQKLDIDANNAVKTIAILPIDEPEAYIAANIGSMKGFLLGPLGGYLEGKQNETYTEKFTSAVNKLSPNFGGELIEAIKEGLVDKGYTVTVLEARPPFIANTEANYSNIKTDADAILDIWYKAAGYISPPNSIGFEPWLMVSSRLVSTVNKKQLYFQAFNYAAELGKIDNIIYFKQLGSKEFSSLDELVLSPSEASEELIKGVPLIAEGILNEL